MSPGYLDTYEFLYICNILLNSYVTCKNLKNDTMYASVTNILLVFLTISFENIVAPKKSIDFFKKYFPPM